MNLSALGYIIILIKAMTQEILKETIMVILFIAGHTFNAIARSKADLGWMFHYTNYPRSKKEETASHHYNSTKHKYL